MKSLFRRRWRYSFAFIILSFFRQTFREEEQRRRRATTEGYGIEGGDLIRFDNPEDAERKKKNDQVGICFWRKYL